MGVIVVGFAWSKAGTGILEWSLRVVFATTVVWAGFSAIAQLRRASGLETVAVGLSVAGRGRAQAPNTRVIEPILINFDQRADVVIRHPDLLERFLFVLSDALPALVVALIALLLANVVRTLRAGDPFTPANARRILTIALLLVGAGLVEGPIHGLLAWTQVNGTPAERLVDIGYSISVPQIGFGLLLAALAEIFRRGATMRADVDGLV